MSNSSTNYSFQRDFFKLNPLAESFLDLLHHLPQTEICIKDRECRYVKANLLFLKSHGLNNESELTGKNDYDFSPPEMARAYIEEDHKVMASGQTLRNQLWLVIHCFKTPRWYMSTKTPLFDAAGHVVGIACVKYLVKPNAELKHHLQEIYPVARYIEKHYSEQISMSDMAELVGLSSTHFNRRFQEVLHMTPMEYLRSVRVQVAQRLLTTTSESILNISIATGFSDQSHMTKRFRQVTGLTPAAYRKQFKMS